jgi:hypothetical protein
MIFASCRRVNDRVIRYHSLAGRAYDLVFHLLSFSDYLEIEISRHYDSFLQPKQPG